MKNAAIHIITARATDARGNVAEISTEMQVSGADDPQKLRIFSDLAEVSEGAALKVDAHSRVAAPLALVTLAGESLLEHRVVVLSAGHNDVAVTVGNAHWPQFEVSVLYLDGEKLQRARRGFVVKRPLSIELETPAVAPEPGAEIDVVVTTKDGLGKPVSAELSLALAGSELFGRYSDESGAIHATFAENLRVRGSIRTSSSAGSGHRGESRMIVKDGAKTPPPRPQTANTYNQQTGGQVTQTIGNGLQIQGNAIFLQNGNFPGEFAPPQIAQVEQNDEVPQGFGGGSPVSKSARSPAKAALWWSPIITDAAGKAIIKVRVPSGGEEWRLLARGCTKSSAFGEASKTLVTKAAPGNVAKYPPVAASAEYDADLRHAGMIFAKPGMLDLPAAERLRTVFSIHDSPRSLLRAMALGLHDSNDGRARTPQTASSQLLAAVASLRASKADGKDDPALAERISLLISALQITQRDGGWTWEDVEWKRDSVVTSLGLWALVEARALGFAVEDASVNSAATFLKSALAIIPPDEPEKAAVILHALAMVNQADFSVANRLLRDRAKLNDPALAHLAAAFLRMERPQEAQELLKALETRPEWTGSPGTGRLSRPDDTAAIILYAAARAQAGSPLAKKATDSVVAKLGVSCGADSPLRGLIAAALAEHFIGTGLHRIAPAQKLELSVDGKRLEAPSQTGNGNAAQRVDVAFADGKGMPILLATSVVRGIAPATPVASLPVIVKREWQHEGMRHNDLPLKAASTSPVTIAALGQRIHVKLTLRGPQSNQSSYVTLDEPLPAGCHLRPETVSSKAVRMEELPGRIRLWFTPGTFRPAAEVVISYELIALHPGDFAIPPTIVRDACRPLRQPAGPAGKLTILEAGKPSPEPYQINRAERLELARLLFDSGLFEEARAHLDILRGDAAAMRDNEREIARMLLWAHTARSPMESKQVVELFETLSERHPDIVIPFDRILKVAEAYRQIGEFERAWLVYRATLEGGFVRDAGVSAALEANGDFPASVEHKLALWQEYPDLPDVSLAYFSLAQSLQDKSAEPGAVPVRPGALKPTKTQLLERSRDLLRRFVTLRAKDDLADDASFSLANVFFDLKDYASVVTTAGTASAAYPKSPFANSFLYMTALGHFWQYQFPEALAAAAPVAAGTSTDAPNARYITAQTYHAQGRPAEAIKWYEKVKDEIDDAGDSIAVLQEKGVKLPPATSIKPGQPVKLELGYRNVKDAALKIYRVDLMKLHERQKDLSEVSAVNLAGITPEAEISVALGDGLDYAWKKRAVELPMKQEGAYLVICRGDSQMTSALVLITTLDMEINEDTEFGNVRVQVRDTVRGSYVADADIATYDSTGTAEPQKGRTDPRGAFSASDIQGYATIVVKLGDTRYAYHRSPAPLRRTQIVKTPVPNAAPAQPAQKQMSKGDYLNNVRELNFSNSSLNTGNWEKKMKSEGQGVKAEKAFKK
jgi:alpha-2-macroglobulin